MIAHYKIFDIFGKEIKKKWAQCLTWHNATGSKGELRLVNKSRWDRKDLNAFALNNKYKIKIFLTSTCYIYHKIMVRDQRIKRSLAWVWKNIADIGDVKYDI